MAKALRLRWMPLVQTQWCHYLINTHTDKSLCANPHLTHTGRLTLQLWHVSLWLKVLLPWYFKNPYLQYVWLRGRAAGAHGSLRLTEGTKNEHEAVGSWLVSQGGDFAVNMCQGNEQTGIPLYFRGKAPSGKHVNLSVFNTDIMQMRLRLFSFLASIIYLLQ